VTEHHVTEALFRRTPGCGRLVVAHRASTAARADSVAWLDGGRVRAVGRHAELWAQAEYRAVFGSDAGDKANYTGDERNGGSS
jgi:ATP-binding cassette subfamily B protein